MSCQQYLYTNAPGLMLLSYNSSDCDSNTTYGYFIDTPFFFLFLPFPFLLCC